ATLQGNQAVWELAQTAKASPALAQRLASEPLPAVEELATLEGGEAFAEEMEHYLTAYGGRTTGWTISTPTLRERPDLMLELVRRTIAEDLPEPAALVSAAAARREATAEEVETRFAADLAKLATFRQLLSRQEPYLGVKEGRALQQLTLGGALRGAILRRGQRLEQSGAIEQVDDVFYLLPNEIDAAMASPALPEVERETLRDRVVERRAEHEHWLSKTPPEMIGAGADIKEEARPAELHGIGVSRGIATGRARVLATYEENARLAPGDILVCGTTTPTWTPLFAIAAAVVAEGGGLLSHTAIAAREYGIPAVAGVRGATRYIPDGAIVTIDGTAGTVTLSA
ncbi:MAG TPA: PEP-utilizing enzyme, partial [Dehalococcoidia bacterium]